jgi:hypothetical protein
VLRLLHSAKQDAPDSSKELETLVCLQLFVSVPLVMIGCQDLPLEPGDDNGLYSPDSSNHGIRWLQKENCAQHHDHSQEDYYYTEYSSEYHDNTKDYSDGCSEGCWVGEEEGR